MMECPLCLHEMRYIPSSTRAFCGRWQCCKGHYIEVSAIALDVPRDIEQPITITEVYGSGIQMGQAQEVA